MAMERKLFLAFYFLAPAFDIILFLFPAFRKKNRITKQQNGRGEKKCSFFFFHPFPFFFSFKRIKCKFQ